jgi:hypothetical protein
MSNRGTSGNGEAGSTRSNEGSTAIPRGVLSDVREGLLCVLGEASEEIADVLMMPEYEHHPEWFTNSRFSLVATWTCLDTIGWAGRERALSVSVTEHGAVLTRAIDHFLPVLDDRLEDAPLNDHLRIAQGLPPEFRSLTARIAALEQLANLLGPDRIRGASQRKERD